MEQSDNGIKAKDTYYETANTEYDRIHKVFDQVDNKIAFLIPVIIGIPIAVIGFASQLKEGDFNIFSIIFGAIGLFAFLGAGWFTMQAIKVRDVKLGVPYDEFNRFVKEYDDPTMREWVAKALMTSSEHNYPMTLKKGRYIRLIEPFLIIEVLAFLLAIICVLASKL